MGSVVSTEVCDVLDKRKQESNVKRVIVDERGAVPRKFSLRVKDSFDLVLPFFDSGMIINLSCAYPKDSDFFMGSFLSSKGISPFVGTGYRSAASHSGVYGSFPQKWGPQSERSLDCQMTEKSKLLFDLLKLKQLSQIPTLDCFRRCLEQKEETMEDCEAELEDKNVVSDEFDEPENTDGVENKKAWGKGVGYGSDYTGDNNNWDVLAWKRQCDSTEKDIVEILRAIKKAISIDDWSFDYISSSSLLPVLIQFCENDSLHDVISKTSLYTEVFEILLKMMNSDRRYMTHIFDASVVFLPSLVARLGHQAEKMVNFALKMGSHDSNSDDAELSLAKLIAKTYRDFEKSITDCLQILDVTQAITGDLTDLSNLKSKLKDIQNSMEISDATSNKPVELRTFHKIDDSLMDVPAEEYEGLMRELCFGGFDEFADFGYHHYSGTRVDAKRKMMRRLAGEFADLPDSLPIHHESSVFFRFCEERMSHAQMLVIPPEDTPYAAGCFIFDICFPQTYPNDPPLVNLQTTGHGSVRFNPNLYECGKVCLSLLGTWDAYSEGEKWNAGVSTFLQLAISIQSLIFVQEPYYNEPGYEDEMGTEYGDERSKEYNDVIELGTAKWAMVDMLKNPPKGWRDVIHAHFKMQGDRAVRNCTKWHGEGAELTKELRRLIDDLRKVEDDSSSDICTGEIKKNGA